jgi:hypothetical protein
MVNHPEWGRGPERVNPNVQQIVYTEAWVPDDEHPLGGRLGVVTVYRRVNLRKDELPRWYGKARPMFEFTKEQK